MKHRRSCILNVIMCHLAWCAKALIPSFPHSLEGGSFFFMWCFFMLVQVLAVGSGKPGNIGTCAN